MNAILLSTFGSFESVEMDCGERSVVVTKCTLFHCGRACSSYPRLPSSNRRERREMNVVVLGA